jgi:hypothetical protein
MQQQTVEAQQRELQRLFFRRLKQMAVVTVSGGRIESSALGAFKPFENETAKQLAVRLLQCCVRL